MKKNMLKQTIIDKKLAWGSSLSIKKNEFVVLLSCEVIDELKLNAGCLKDKNVDNFPLLRSEIESFKNTNITYGFGLFIIEGKIFSEFSKDEVKNIYVIISAILGILLEQNIKGERVVKIMDQGKLLSTGGRYHQTSDGGSYHTDGPHWMIPPDIIGLLCINPALEGGASKFISAYTIHNEILKKGVDKLKPLYENFFFDRREEVSKSLRVISKPVFHFSDNRLYCRYLKDYIVSGHQILDTKLSTLQKESLDLIRNISESPKNILNYDLKINDMVFSDNHRLLHGRDAFKDSNSNNKKRELLRVWVKSNIG
jgi:hypothetical protein